MSLLSARLPQVSPSRSNVLTGVLIGLALLACLIAFHGPLLELERRWSQQEEYSHGFLIPVVTAWLLWARRDLLRTSVGPPSWTGLALIVLAALMNTVGQLSAITILSQVGFVVTLAGIVLAFGGYSLLRATLIPIVFLLFAIPLPYFVDSVLTLQLQLISSKLGVFVIRLLQIPVYLDGNIIDLGTSKPPGQVLVGFAAETDDVEANALRKLRSKRLDLIVANDVGAPGAGFEHDTNEVMILGAYGVEEKLPMMSKADVARAVVDAAVRRLMPIRGASQ